MKEPRWHFDLYVKIDPMASNVSGPSMKFVENSLMSFVIQR